MQPLKYFLFLTLTHISGECLKLLGIFPHTSYSHTVVYKHLLEKLRENGHDLILAAEFSLKHINSQDIKFPPPPNNSSSVNLEKWTASKSENYIFMHGIHVRLNEWCNHLLSSQEYSDIVNSNNNFDLLITEYFTTSCHIIPLVQKWNVPFVVIQTSAISGWSGPWIAVPDNPAYIPISYSEFSRNMDFYERLENTVIWALSYLYYYTLMVFRDDNFLSRYTQCTDLTSHEIMQNASLVLINSHFSYQNPRPNPPNVVEVGGMHIEDIKPLPQHLEKWINESAHGVVYFSLGSMIKGHTFPDEKKQMFLNAFKRIPQRVLWKWENETMPGKPDNVMIDKWMPQLDVLCHPNVKGFISHGGLLGATEGVHCGVPMIIMPQFGDQFTNAKAVETSGGGVIVDYRNLDEESIYEALTTILSPDFNKQVKELSARFKDRPLPPLETAIYWVEYVARHRGAPHLKTAAVGMPLYQYLLLDVIAFLAVILFSFIFIIYYITRALFRRLCKSGKASAKLKKN